MNRATDQMNEALDAHASILEGALEVVERRSPWPFQKPATDSEHLANAIVQAANIQAAATIATSARRYVTSA